MQWNLETYNTTFSNLKIILNKYQPICVAFQETRTKNEIVKPPSQYNIVTSSITRQDNHERETAMSIHRSFNYEQVPINTTLQACAVKMYMDKMQLCAR